MRSFNIHAGRVAMQHIHQFGLRAEDIRCILGPATGLAGFVLNPLDRFIFGTWLKHHSHPVDLIGSSFGALRMAAACCSNPDQSLMRLQDQFIYDVVEPGFDQHSSHSVRDAFTQCIEAFYQSSAQEIANHSRFRLHVLASRGRRWLNSHNRAYQLAGLAAAFAANSLKRQHLQNWLERVIFEHPHSEAYRAASRPFNASSFRTEMQSWNPSNLTRVLLASCSIPLVLPPVIGNQGLNQGLYWDGGLIDYDMCLDYSPIQTGLILMPNTHPEMFASWFDEPLRRAYPSANQLDRLVVISPDSQWIKSLPQARLPSRQDFALHRNNKAARVAQWKQCIGQAQQLVDDFAEWLEHPDFTVVHSM